MRILNLEIKNIRGIKNISIEPKGKNIIVFGPNGTGKSAIVDAVDFLLTGKISRLTGEGAKPLSLKQHGCHVDSRTNLKETVVTAKVEIEGKELVMERSINKPSLLKIAPKENKELVHAHLRVTELGQHILTRRDILDYIAAEAGKRAKKVMSLLDLENIEALRSAFVTMKNEAENELKNATANFEVSKTQILTLLSLDSFSEVAVLDKVNELRRTLNGSDIPSLSTEIIKKDLVPQPFGTTVATPTVGQAKNIIREIRKLVEQKATMGTKEAQLKALLEEIGKEANLKKCLLYKALIEAGIGLVDDSNVCPLCDRKWEGDFRQYLKEKESETEVSKQKHEEINEISGFVNVKLSLLKSNLNECIAAYERFKLEDLDEAESKEYMVKLDLWTETINNPLMSFYTKKWPSSGLETTFDSPCVRRILDRLENALKVLEPTLSVSQAAWDILTRMEDNWSGYLRTLEQKKKCEVFKDRAVATLDYFEKARDSVLTSIYDAVRSSFDEYYRAIHSDDESKFTSKISHEGAELNFEVDFYERGMFPPNAVHSEGHQDSMGLCLFFALNKYLVKDIIEVIILDDVVMSIDCSHRRGICDLLKEYLKDRQLIITTHDGAWAKQLRTQGIVQQENMIHFTNWNIETGPVYELDKDLWDKIEEYLKEDNIPTAAHMLRRNAELFFEDVCDFLGASITYKGNHQWELGDLAPAAISAYKKSLKKAKENAQKAGQNEKFKELDALDRKAGDIMARSQIEQWVINENVHYNKWKEFTKNDFEPVVKVFKELFELFNCTTCGSLIALNESKGKSARSAVTCNCGKIFWDVS